MHMSVCCDSSHALPKTDKIIRHRGRYFLITLSDGHAPVSSNVLTAAVYTICKWRQSADNSYAFQDYAARVVGYVLEAKSDRCRVQDCVDSDT